MNIGCSFLRDGVALESEDKFNMLFADIYRSVHSHIPEDFKETIKIANLDNNDNIYNDFLQWKFLFEKSELDEEINQSYEFQSLQSKKNYNESIGKLLKIYLDQSNITNLPNHKLYNPYHNIKTENNN